MNSHRGPLRVRPVHIINIQMDYQFNCLPSEKAVRELWQSSRNSFNPNQGSQSMMASSNWMRRVSIVETYPTGKPVRNNQRRGRDAFADIPNKMADTVPQNIFRKAKREAHMGLSQGCARMC